jgi:hypothetical protein
MRKILFLYLLIAIMGIYGCKSIHVGGSGGSGTVSGSGQVTVSIPQQLAK